MERLREAKLQLDQTHNHLFEVNREDKDAIERALKAEGVALRRYRETLKAFSKLYAPEGWRL